VRRVTFRERARYRIDNLLARGPAPLIVGLFIFTLAAALIVSAVVVLAGWAAESGFLDPFDTIWRAILTTIDSGAIGNYTGGTASPAFLLAMLAVTIFGILVTSILIGILVTGLQTRLEELRKGRSAVVESGHVVILGWSQQIFTVISELTIANENKRGNVIVVMADRDKVQMEDDIRSRVTRPGRTRIVCRSGSPVDVGDLELVSLQTAKSIVVLSPESDDADASTIKTILAITNGRDRRPEPYHIVAEVRDPANLDVARMVGREEAQLLLVGDLVARIIAQTCRQSGLSVVYTELLDFDGDEIYFAAPPQELVGRSFGDVLLAYEDSTVIGIHTAGGIPHLNPPMDTAIAAGDQLIAISRDDDTVRPGSQSRDGIREDLIVAPAERRQSPERTLILGWNWRGPAIVRELDAYVAPGSGVVIVADLPDVADSLEAVRPGLRSQTVEVRRGDTTDRGLLDRLEPRSFDHLIVLCYSDVLELQLADARTLITLLHLRDIAAIHGHDFSIVSEMLDLRNRALAEVTQADDFIVSDRMTSLLISQVAENRHLKAVFDDLFDPEGSEIYLRPAAEYVAVAQPMTFATVVEAARRRGEVAIGFRRKRLVDDAAHAYGVALNPVKSAPITFEPGDRVIVLAEDGFKSA
jgi:voltage-gated potassium channel Kch